jgi:prepilin-type N-terminal cleavage/methylation domain-containing protein
MRNIRNNRAAGKAQQGGFTLVELIAVIAIGFGIIFLALTKVPQLLANTRASGEITELPGITAEMQRIAMNRPNWSTFTLDSMIRNNAFPESRVTIPAGAGAATAQNRWGGAITFAPAQITNTGDIARITYSAVPQRECKAVALGVAQVFRRVYVDGANSGTAGAGTLVKGDGLRVDEAQVGTACSGEVNSITFDLAK